MPPIAAAASRAGTHLPNLLLAAANCGALVDYQPYTQQPEANLVRSCTTVAGVTGLCKLQAAVQILADSLGRADWAVKAVLPAARQAEQESLHPSPHSLQRCLAVSSSTACLRHHQVPSRPRPLCPRCARRRCIAASRPWSACGSLQLPSRPPAVPALCPRCALRRWRETTGALGPGEHLCGEDKSRCRGRGGLAPAGSCRCYNAPARRRRPARPGRRACRLGRALSCLRMEASTSCTDRASGQSITGLQEQVAWASLCRRVQLMLCCASGLDACGQAGHALLRRMYWRAHDKRMKISFRK